MNYRNAVVEGKRLVKRSEEDQWRLAELTHEVVEGGKSRRQWAKDIGVHHSTAQRYYNVWERWGGAVGATRPRFSDAYATIRVGSEEIVTASQEMQRRVPTRPEDRIEMARKLLADQDVAAQVVRDNKVMASIAGAEQDRVDDLKTQRRSEGRPAAAEPADEMHVHQKLFHAKKDVRDAMEYLGDEAGYLLRKQSIRNDLLEASNEVRAALDFFDAAVGGKGKTIEEMLNEWEVS